MKNILVCFIIQCFFCAYANQLFAQVGGISGSKITSINHKPLPNGVAEFEPSYNFSVFSKQWNAEGKLEDAFSSSDSLSVSANWNLRMAYPISKRVELGAILGADFSNWSAKYALGTWENFGLGAMAGLNLPFGNAQINKNNREASSIGNYGLGLIASYEFDEITSLDINVQNFKNLYEHQELSNNDLYITADFGRYFGPSLLVASVYYQYSDFDAFKASVFQFTPGISYEKKENYVLVLNGNFSLFGKNMPKTFGFSMACTIVLQNFKMTSERLLWTGGFINFLCVVLSTKSTFDLQLHDTYFVLSSSHFYLFFLLSFVFRALLHRNSKRLNLHSYIIKGHSYVSFLSGMIILFWIYYSSSSMDSNWSLRAIHWLIFLAAVLYLWVQLIYLFHFLQRIIRPKNV